MRQLVTIRAISEVVPIDGADQIEVIKLDGWQCVAKKNEFLAGDLAMYHEIDSFLPQHPRYDFLAARGMQTNGDGSKGYRLRTIRLRGQLSQGLALPVSQFPEILDEAGAVIELSQDADLAEIIGVAKYEQPIPAQLAGQVKGTFPWFLKKTDQERIQNMTWVLEDDGAFEVTQKLDGSSMTVFWRDGEFGVCSRNMELKETEGNTFWQVANRYGLRERLSQFGMNIALQGELVGPGIQGNSHGLLLPDFFVFDIFLIDVQRHASPDGRLAILQDMRDIKQVPLIDEAMTLDRFDSVSSVLAFAEQTEDKINPKNNAPEGVVFKRKDGQQSFKAISNRYLLKEK